MSVLSALALFLTAGAAATNRRAESDKRVAELEARVAELEDAIATANAHARRDQELIDLWRERALSAIPGPPPGFGPPVPQIALHQMAQAQNAMAGQQSAAAMQQQLAQYTQAMQNQALAQSMGLLGAQMIDAELYCNCVPSRQQVWAAKG